jgi:hypothetical protein
MLGVEIDKRSLAHALLCVYPHFPVLRAQAPGRMSHTDTLFLGMQLPHQHSQLRVLGGGTEYREALSVGGARGVS